MKQQRLVESEHRRRDGAWGDACEWRLWVPDDGAGTTSGAAVLLSYLALTGLDQKVAVVTESRADSLDFIRSYIDGSSTQSEPYLERTQGGCSAGVSYYTRAEIMVALEEVLVGQQRGSSIASAGAREAAA